MVITINLFSTNDIYHDDTESDEDSRFLTPSIVIQDQASFIDGSVSTAGDIYPLLQGADIMAQGVDSPSTIMQSLKWQAFMPETWFILLCGSTLQEMYRN